MGGGAVGVVRRRPSPLSEEAMAKYQTSDTFADLVIYAWDNNKFDLLMDLAATLVKRAEFARAAENLPQYPPS